MIEKEKFTSNNNSGHANLGPEFGIYMKQILGIRFSEHGQVLTCRYTALDTAPAIPLAHGVMVTTEQGLSFGRVVWERVFLDAIIEPLCDDDEDRPEPDLFPASTLEDFVAAMAGQTGDSSSAPTKVPSAPATLQSLPEVRHATVDELVKATENDQMCREARTYCRRCISERNLDMKLVDVETMFDRGKMIFYFTAPTRIDFRELVKDLVRQYHTRIELRQIGVRHETQMLGALGNCGMVCCCRRYLRKFAPVTIKMAKEQNLFLNPAKISGICGRLLCCLSYEQENYDSFHRSCPKLGKRYQTDQGPMRVLRGNMFRNTVIVLPDGGQELEFTLDDWQALNPHRAEASPTPPAKGPRPSHEFMVVSAGPDSLEEDLAGLKNLDTPAAPSEGRHNRQPQQQDGAQARSKRRRRKKMPFDSGLDGDHHADPGSTPRPENNAETRFGQDAQPGFPETPEDDFSR